MTADDPIELVLLVRRPPGRGHLYRFAGERVRVGRDPDSQLCLEGPGIEPTHLVFERTAAGFEVRAQADAALNGRALAPGEARPVDTADALELGDRIIELAVEHDPAPTTDRHDAGRLRRVQAAEQRVREASGPSLWVLRGGAAGMAVPIDAAGVVCGAGLDDGLRLPDVGIEPGHFTVRAAPDGGLWLSARAPVRVRGRAVREARLVPGELVFVGPAVCEVRGPPAAPGGWGWWPVAAVMAMAVALLGAAWWTALQ